MNLRPADESDAARLFAWRRDGATVTASIDPPPKTFEDHMVWLNAMLGDDTEVDIFVASDGARGVSVGVVRLDYSGSIAEVSIVVDPAQRGRGYAAEMLTNLLAREALAATLVAMVKETNYASLRLFWAAGFRDVAASDGVLRLERTWS